MKLILTGTRLKIKWKINTFSAQFGEFDCGPGEAMCVRVCVCVRQIFTLQWVRATHHVRVRDTARLQDTSLGNAGGQHLLC